MSSDTLDKIYDVFLSFNDDAKRSFTGNLYNALRHKKIKTYFLDKNDDSDEDYDQLSPSDLKAIQGSKISIVVLSQYYASSSRCTDELGIILECMRMKNQLVWPILYKADISNVRPEEDGADQVRTYFNMKPKFSSDSDERVQRRKQALWEVSNLNRRLYRGTDDECEYDFIQNIVESVVKSLPHYDIFISFTGEDTRHSFTGVLYHALHREGFKIFMDDEELEGGNQISKTLLESIEKSRLSIVVFSENYAYSSWCLDELDKIIECMKTNNQLVLPIFYKVEPLDVSNQTNSYGHAMIAHENRFGKESEKVQKWRSTLSEIGFLEGEHVKENEYEFEFIKKIVQKAIDIEQNM
uniref:TIR domain-containing protein n=3 Tax=Lotus japonicus TaxID=34305 RepID=I3T873_LOTJA|nr:unknown [Lotus japonicus]